MADILSWDKSIDEDVKTSDDKKVGKIRAVTTDLYTNSKRYCRQKILFCAKTLHPGIRWRRHLVGIN